MLPSQDLVSGVDFTVLSGFDGSLLDQALATQVPNQTDIQNGIGLILTTQDVQLGVPNIPDLLGQDVKKWRRYLWNRKPFPGSVDKTCIVYSWNDDAPVDPIFSQWVTTRADISTINDSITTLQEGLAVVTDTADTANANASNAVTVSNAANTTSANASALASTAQASATTAQTAANSANTLATSATATANNAATVANAASALASGNKPVNQLVPGTAGQRARTNATATAFELYGESNCFVLLTEDQLNNVSPAAIVSGSFKDRVINTNVQDLGLLITSLVANVFTPIQGTYRIRAVIPIDCPSTQQTMVSRLYNATDNVQVLQSANASLNLSGGISGTGFTINNEIQGIFTTDGTKGFKIQSWILNNANGGSKVALGLTERYLTCELTLIN